MIRFRDALSASDREHVRRILDSSLSTTLKAFSKVVEFLRDATYIDDRAIQAFKELAQADRERLISELVWRVTCLLDGSVTRVVGVNAYPLGKQFAVVQTGQDGRDVVCVALVS